MHPPPSAWKLRDKRAADEPRARVVRGGGPADRNVTWQTFDPDESCGCAESPEPYFDDYGDVLNLGLTIAAVAAWLGFWAFGPTGGIAGASLMIGATLVYRAANMQVRCTVCREPSRVRSGDAYDTMTRARAILYVGGAILVIAGASCVAML